MRDDFSEYLKRLDRLGEPGLAFAPAIYVDAVRAQVETACGGRPVITLVAHGPVAPEKKDIDEAFRKSFERPAVLVVVVGSQVPPMLLKALEQICEDRAFYQEQEGGGWGRLTPPPEWRLLVVAEVPELAALPGALVNLFPAPFAL